MGDEAAMTRKPKEKPTGFSREEGKLILDDVLKRYRIHPSGHPEGIQGKMMPPAAPKVEAEELLPDPITSGPAAARTPYATVRQPELGAPLDFGWRRHLLDMAAIANIPVSNDPNHEPAADEVFMDKSEVKLVPTESQEFHYLIRVLECAFTLHCQVTAASAADARDQVERIPNLIEWRETSVKEIAELTKIEEEAGRSDPRRL
jgi:hypothetical protein